MYSFIINASNEANQLGKCHYVICFYGSIVYSDNIANHLYNLPKKQTASLTNSIPRQKIDKNVIFRGHGLSQCCLQIRIA